MVFASLLIFVGKAFQAIPVNSTLYRSVILNVGHVITMFPAMIANGGPPLVSATWFPPNERTTATAIASLAAFMGTAVAFVMGPALVSDSNITEIRTNVSREDASSQMESEIMVR